MSLDHIVSRNARRYPDKPALIMGDTQLGWASLDERVNRLANAFSDAGMAAGQHVAILLGNCPEYLEIYFACARGGLVAVPLNYRLKPAEIAGILSHSDPALFIFGSEYTRSAREAAAMLAALPKLWVVGDATVNGAGNYQHQVAAAVGDRVASAANDDDTIAIFYTSGTTGSPKGAMVSHRNLEMNGYNQMLADGSRADDVNLVATPLYHMGAVFMAVTYMMLGCTQTILPSFDPRAWLRAVEEKRITVSLLIPTMINAVVNTPGVEQSTLDTLRLVFYGGGPMPPAVLKRAIETLDCGFTQGYGLTETLEATFLTADDHVLDGDEQQTRRLASAGREAVGADVRIVNSDSVEVPAGEVGEILIRSHSVISGYWKQPDETARVLRDGWFHTGDLGYLDEDRYLFVVDRMKDMIITGGVNVYTKEIEECLYQHPAVLEAAVIGLPDDHWGEIITAVIVRREAMDVEAEELTGYCGKHLAGFKKPRRVFFVAELPKNPSGKILKRELRRSLGMILGDEHAI